MASRHLLNPLAPLGQPTPSALDGVPPDMERELRAYGALLIQQAGVMLKAPQVVMATAQVLFQRFWFVTSMKHFGIRDIGMGALFLSSKLEESPLRLRDIINAYSYLSSLSQHCSTPPYPPAASFTSYIPMDYFATEFYDLKDATVIAEMQILKRLGFQTQCGLPYGHLVNYLQVLELAGDSELVRRCWGFCNDMLQTPAPALYPQSTLALTAIYLATRLSTPAIALPLTPAPWWTLFDATEQELVDVGGMLLSLYRDWGSEILDAGREVGEKEAGESVWKRAGRIPVTKKGVREALALKNGDGNGRGGDER
ncbi:SPOSA6832_02454 [Sporobolomyces salmonicolor]|uniref:SPOSA6832_02454-mRNA-1:cds n=1 Tax=Sporidiobolus salmonicolor TaxID=5005 RepID=A0A0D6EMG9_SPOSA|nr:SPOSA6832_02454 [Sporobolomyces salmonicolor]